MKVLEAVLFFIERCMGSVLLSFQGEKEENLLIEKKLSLLYLAVFIFRNRMYYF